MEINELITLSELARRLRVSKRWLREEAASGRLPSIAAGAQHLFNLRVVERLLAERAASPAKEQERVTGRSRPRSTEERA